MKLLSRLRHRFEHLVRELAKFGSVGAIAFVITMVLSNALHNEAGLGMGPLSSNAIATVVATTFSYVANRYWTFRHRDRTGLGREYVLFFALNGVGLVITQLFIGFVHYVLGLHGPLFYNAALILGTGAATLFRFWSYKKWVFLPVEAAQVDPHSGLPGTAPAEPAASERVNGRSLPSHGLGRPIGEQPAEGRAEFTRSH
ncbi:GtrA family protein [Actinomadura sp. 21ATH]|uniref:GtrA family protein n=1 Tax=Actinomadura sp. 21ATH TaxID=1735444 RepID=UPI0035C25521